jgi:GTP-binding protein HflX
MRKRLQNESRRDPSHPVFVSAVTGEGLAALRTEIEARLNASRSTSEIVLAPSDGALANWIYENCEVVERHDRGEGKIALLVRVSPDKEERLERLAGKSRVRARTH